MLNKILLNNNQKVNSKNTPLKNRLINRELNNMKGVQNLNNTKISVTNLKKYAGSAVELTENDSSYLRKAKTKSKNFSFANMNPIDYIYPTTNKKISFITPKEYQSNPKIIILQNDKNNIKDNNANDENQNIKKEEKNDDEEINCLLRNEFTNVKIFPTTILNNQIIYNQTDKNNQNNQNQINTINNKKIKSDQNDNSKIIGRNNSKVRNEKIFIENIDKKEISKNENFDSIEEVHFFYVRMLKKGKEYEIKLDKPHL